MVLCKGLVRRHGRVPEPDRPSPHPPSAPNRAPAPTVPAAALPGSCSLHPQLSPTNSHTCSPKGPAPTRRPPAPGPSGLQNGAKGWTRLVAPVHFCTLCCCRFWRQLHRQEQLAAVAGAGTSGDAVGQSLCPSCSPAQLRLGRSASVLARLLAKQVVFLQRLTSLPRTIDYEKVRLRCQNKMLNIWL